MCQEKQARSEQPAKDSAEEKQKQQERQAKLEKYLSAEQKELLYKWKSVWAPPKDAWGLPEDDIITQYVIVSYCTSCSKAVQNKDKNFKRKDEFIDLVYSILILECIALISALASGAFQDAGSGLITGLVFLSIFQAGAFYATGKQISVRKYQETWARHSYTFGKMQAEMILYLYSLPPYKGLEENKKKERFIRNFLEIQEDNQKKFVDNMETKEENILDIAEKLKLPSSK